MKAVLANLHYKNLLRWRDTKLSDPLLVISEKLSANFLQFLLSGSFFGQFRDVKYVLLLILDLKKYIFLSQC